MFGGSKDKIEGLERQVADLRRQLDDLTKKQEHQLKVLRQQTVGILNGLPPSATSVMNGLPYSEIPKERVLEFIQSVPGLLILDVRSDEGWSNGHIPEAKHIPANQVMMRMGELSDKSRPILTFCANGNTAVTAAQLLAKEGFLYVFNALGGMAGYTGPLVKPEVKASDSGEVKGVDRELIEKILAVIDRDVRPGLKRDGGDLQVLAVEDGVVKVKMSGACFGCGAQKRTVEDGIKSHLMRIIPEVKDVEDHSGGHAH